MHAPCTYYTYIIGGYSVHDGCTCSRVLSVAVLSAVRDRQLGLLRGVVGPSGVRGAAAGVHAGVVAVVVVVAVVAAPVVDD
jgi:hypothetical protein